MTIKTVNYLIQRGQLKEAVDELNQIREDLPLSLYNQKRSEIAKGIPVISSLYIDITDYVIFFLQRSVVSGIQRVVHSILKYIVNGRLRDHYQFVYCIIHPISGLFGIVKSDSLLELLDVVESGCKKSINNRASSLLMETAYGEEIPLFESDVLLIPGGPWASSVQLFRYKIARRKSCFAVISVCYDIIPIQYPEFCSQGLVDVFTSAYDALSEITDCFISISHYSSKQLICYQESLGVRRSQELYKTWRLGDYDKNFPLNPSEVPEKIASLDLKKKGDYALVVSTIEPRKNHYNLLRAWRLASEILPKRLEMPSLVLAGKVGWNSSDFMEQVEAFGKIGIKVTVLEDLDDESISWLYYNCRFVVMPSYVEGWGLSITEALMRGKLCLASNTSSMIEASDGLCPLFDPYNSRDMANVITETIRGDLDGKAVEAIASYKPVSWEASVDAFSECVFEALDTIQASHGRGELGMATRPIIVKMSNGKLRVSLDSSIYQRSLSSFCCWYPIEEQGFARSIGAKSFIDIESDHPFEGICVKLIRLHSVDALKFEVMLDGSCLETNVTCKHGAGSYDQLYDIGLAGLIVSAGVIIRVVFEATTSASVAPPHDPRLSSFALHQISLKPAVKP